MWGRLSRGLRFGAMQGWVVVVLRLAASCWYECWWADLEKLT